MANIFKQPCDEGVIRSKAVVAPCARAAAPWVLAATILGSSMAFIDGTVVNVALPALQANLDATVQDVQWVVEAYVLFLAALLLVGGSLGARPLDRQALLPVMTPCRPDSLSIQEEEPTCSKQKLQ